MFLPSSVPVGQVFFPPDPTPFPGLGELCSNHFYYNESFVFLKFFFFLFYFVSGDMLFPNIKSELMVKVNTNEGYCTIAHLKIFITAIYIIGITI